MRKPLTHAALLVAAAGSVLLMGGCTVVLNEGAPATTPTSVSTDPASETGGGAAPDAGSTAAPGSSPAPGSTPGSKPKPGKTTGGSGSGASGPRVEYLKIDQKPKCPEGTNVYQSPAVPLKISWKVSGATGAALSVDQPGAVGSYGTYDVTGSQEFTFSCGGAVGSLEKHTYTIHPIGADGKPGQPKTLTVTTKVLEKGTPV